MDILQVLIVLASLDDQHTDVGILCKSARDHTAGRAASAKQKANIKGFG